jgi:hypothetical protein
VNPYTGYVLEPERGLDGAGGGFAGLIFGDHHPFFCDPTCCPSCKARDAALAVSSEFIHLKQRQALHQIANELLRLRFKIASLHRRPSARRALIMRIIFSRVHIATAPAKLLTTSLSSATNQSRRRTSCVVIPSVGSLRLAPR